MDQEKIGKFIAELRNEKEMTQQELASQIGVTDRAISKWENGRGLPDPSIMLELCEVLEISLNELFLGKKIKTNDVKNQSEKNIINILKFSNLKIKKERIIRYICILFIFLLTIISSRMLLIKKGILLDSNLKYTQPYISGEGNIKDEVDIVRFIKRNIDYDIGANKYGYAVFKNPEKALKKMKKECEKGILLIQKEFHLLPFNSFNFRTYSVYGWQVTTGSEEEQEQARFVSQFLDIYENSFN